ncbi:Hpr(Ser) kinase/phosphatase [Sulfitobacter marinus]|uniref:Hpr(Ser) kinase/phosphatase n=1 Tax=Sulfitobacter marinus TaxID=394264 RepID=A0A1I6VL40_9RHOB|nr:Hpr(Ser) kinase/phosphatase [Sulfitobacter marinus]
MSEQVIHATTVCVGDRGLIILGPSGAGKSTLALQLLALGAVLVADDRTHIAHTALGLVAQCPSAICGMIEARGVGILHLPYEQAVPICLAVDMGQDEAERLPAPHEVKLLGQSVPCLHKSDGPHFAAVLFLSLQNVQPKPNV